MIVNPGIRRFLGSAIQRLFNSASFYAPLTHSLVPERGTGSPTFTRASTATVMGYGPTDNAVDGLKLLTVAANEARFVGARRLSEGVWSNTFADGSLIPAATNTGYLAEGARTNLCLHSQDLSNAAWTKINVTVMADSVAAPDGTTTADKITGAAGTSNKYWFQPIVIGTTANTWSKHLKFGTHQFVQILTDQDTSGYVNFDLVNGTYSASTATAKMVPLEDGWYRCEANFPAAALAVGNLYGVLVDSLAAARFPTSASTGYIYEWGSQSENNASFASTYIATTTAAVTRAADVLTYPSAGNLVASSAADTWYAEIQKQNLESTAQAILDTNVNYRGLTTISANKAQSFHNTLGTSSTSGSVLVAGVVSKVATVFDGSNATCYLNGSSFTNVTGAPTPANPTTLYVGAPGNTGSPSFNGTIRNVRIWQRQLSASEMQAITA